MIKAEIFDSVTSSLGLALEVLVKARRADSGEVDISTVIKAVEAALQEVTICRLRQEAVCLRQGLVHVREALIKNDGFPNTVAVIGGMLDGEFNDNLAAFVEADNGGKVD